MMAPIEHAITTSTVAEKDVKKSMRVTFEFNVEFVYGVDEFSD